MEKHDKVQTVNPKTGDIKDGYFVYVAYPKAKIRNTRWMMTFQDSLKLIAMDEDLTGQTFRVLMLLMSHLEFENYITIKQVEVAKELKMYKQDVSKAVKMLVDKSIILKVKEGTTTGYKLNPYYGWKGKVENMDKEKGRVLQQEVVEIDKAREILRPAPKMTTDTSGIEPDEVPY